MRKYKNTLIEADYGIYVSNIIIIIRRKIQQHEPENPIDGGNVFL